MLEVEEARTRILAGLEPLPAETVPLLDALGRVMAKDAAADYDIPPHANTAMDGYAIRAADTAGASRAAPVRLRVIGELAAGYAPDREVTPGTAVRIMTGGPIPPGADAVVRFELVELEGDHVVITAPVPVGKEVRDAGEDVRAGETVIPKGTVLRAQEIGMLAALGRPQVSVTRRPRVGILSTGDELVGIDGPLGPGKIRDANSYSNAGQVRKYGGIPVPLGIARDREEEIAERLRAGISQGVDLIIVSGGVSVGDFDVVKRVLAAEGRIEFWRVRMKPGKPLAFGYLKSEGREVPMIGTPGNPVSTMVSFEMFARPALGKLLGVRDLDPLMVTATFANTIPGKDDRRHYLRVRLEERDGELIARLTGDQGSGILRSMVEADGLAVIPADWDRVDPGARVSVILLGRGL
ncbi:molybdopterin molybdenumtransferase MoeA [Candidatus Acetothermia bacterium]|nr:MAG: molybdopterin molybdenumtransferase MoeA [Candidatus Acetothermia bacterium]